MVKVVIISYLLRGSVQPCDIRAFRIHDASSTSYYQNKKTDPKYIIINVSNMVNNDGTVSGVKSPALLEDKCAKIRSVCKTFYTSCVTNLTNCVTHLRALNAKNREKRWETTWPTIAITVV